MKRIISLLIVVLFGAVGCQSSPTPTAVPPTSTSVPPSPTPTQTSVPLTGIAAIVKNIVDARNAKNVDAAMSFFTDDAVYTNIFGAKYQGKAEIRSLFQERIDRGYQYELSNVKATGNTVTFHLNGFIAGNFTDKNDTEAVLQGDKVASWTDH